MIKKSKIFFNIKKGTSFYLVMFLLILFYVSAFNMNSVEISKINSIALVNNQNITYSLNGWNYSKKIKIDPKTPVNNYQVKVDLNSSNFNYNYSNKDGSDLRFTDLNNNSLNYWIQQWQYGGNSTIWVKVNNVGTSAIIMYYGNPSAQSQSDGQKTFLFFDNFTENSLNTSKWIIDEDIYSVLSVNSGLVNLTSTAPNPYYQYLAIGFDNLTLHHGQTFGNTIDTSVMLRNNQLIIHNLDRTASSNLTVPEHKWIRGEIQWINSSFVQYVDNNSVSQLTSNMPQNELPISLSASGIIYGPGTWYGIVLKSNFLAGEGTAVGFNCYQNTTYNSNEYPNLIVNWIYVRVLDNNSVYHWINNQQTQQTNQTSASLSHNSSLQTTPASLSDYSTLQTTTASLSDYSTLQTTPAFEEFGLLGSLCCIYVVRKKIS